jgi:hypothetical protein
MHNEELHIRMIKSRMMRWEGYVASMGGERIGMHMRFLWKSQKETDHEKDLDVGGWIILNWIIQRYDGML